MTPSSIIFDVWTHDNSDPNIVVYILFPTGILIPLEVKRDASLLEIKEDVWEEAQQYPLYGMLREMQTYVFVCVNQTTAEQEELVDEERKLCDVRPFQAVLRLVERKGDKAEKLLKTQIGLLIGKGLHEFEALKNPEVNDFRWQMRHFCEEVAKEREAMTWLEKVLYQYPIRVAQSSKLSPALQAQLENGLLVVNIQFETTERVLKLSVPHDITPEVLLDQAMEMRTSEIGFLDDPSEYLLKISGREEFLLQSYPLSQYKYIRDMISSRKNPELVIYPAKNINVEMDEGYEIMEEVDRRSSRNFGNTSTLGGRRNKSVKVCSWTVEEHFGIGINAACKLNCDDNTKLAVQAGLYHGEELLCQTRSTETATVTDGECVWDEQLQFEIAVCDLPRMTKLCLTIYDVCTTRNNKARKQKASNGQEVSVNPMVWANITTYDFKGTLKGGAVTLNMWPHSEEQHNHNMLNPLGSVVSNPNKENSAAFTITFKRFENYIINYPNFEKVLEFAAMKADVEMGATAKAPQASKVYLEQLRQICDKDPLHEMHEQDKELMWFLRQDCRDNLPHSLPKLLRCLKWNDHRDVSQMMAILQIWPPLPPEKALELLDYAYADKSVRNFAVQCLQDISDEDLALYLLQLVQAIKYELYLQSDLVKFLLRRALVNQHIGHRLFWLLRSEMSNPAAAIHFGLILEAYCYGATEHIKSLSTQVEALNKLRALSEFIRVECNRKKEGRDKIKTVMHDMLGQRYFQDAFAFLQSPLDPTQRFRKLRPEKCRFMDSKMKPLWLVFENYDTNAQDVYVMFKNGDDLRQDMLTLQMIRIMDKLWKDEGLDLRMIPYQCLATDHKVGLIEIVRDANTIANIQKEKGFTATSAFKRGSLLAWLKEHNPDETAMNKVVKEFTLSCAGYCVATYVLGIADRHNDNIMVKTNGQLFHIDFGHILGNFKEKFGIRRERVPFVLTHDFVHVITNGSRQKSEEFNRFQLCCEEAFMILRRKGSLIISLFAMMLSTGIPELTCEKDLDYLRETLVLEMSESDARQHFRCKFVEALKSSWTTSFNWVAHSLAKDNKISE